MGWREWNVTLHVQAMHGTVNNGFLVRDATETGLLPSEQAFNSREATPENPPPELVITFG